MPSFDIVSKVDLQEVDNAINQTMKEIGARYDFKGTDSQLVLDHDKAEIKLTSADETHLKSMTEVLHAKFAKRNISILALKYEKVEKASGNRVRQIARLVQGVDKDLAREITKRIKESGAKVTSAYQDEQLRVTGKKKDDLQEVIAALRKAQVDLGAPLQFVNFRD